MHPQICGYLEPKHPEIRKLSLASPLFMRRKARREWAVLDSIGSKLLVFHDEESANNPKKDPLYTVPLVNSIFLVEPESPSTFSILSSSRKYTYQAETRSAMLAWLCCLQTCRDTGDGDPKRNIVDCNETTERWSSTTSLNNRYSDFQLLRCDSKTYSFTSPRHGVLKARASPQDSIDPTDSAVAASPLVVDGTHFFPEDKPPLPSPVSPSRGKALPISSDSGSLSETDEVNNFMKTELQQALDKIKHLRKANETLESELHDLQVGYASLLQSCYKYKLDGALEGDRYAEFPINEKHKDRVGHLLDAARRDDPRLPSVSLISSYSGHTNIHGFQESFDNEETAMLYLTSLLLHTYRMTSSSEVLKVAQWNEILRSDFNLVPRARLKELCRGGIPSGMRHQVWEELVKLGTTRFQLELDPQYYQNLVNKVNDSQVDSCCRRQITLDVLRTFPNHIAFNRPEGFGVQKMQEILQAFTIHNPAVGYCQGMNFIVGNASLFLDKETAFWLLVLIVEHYFPPNYFNEGLIAAQADQIILRDLIAKYCPRIANAMRELEVDISTITLNWFIAVFVNSLPIEVSPPPHPMIEKLGPFNFIFYLLDGQ
ncbi:TBC1 domain family member 2B [Taenia crassiceps]|uniref:TBC1 domain family member 2B n=1 Tax=Taenia crassiceps TaxID=6207 RepID=A0ABR4Q4X8_9CEST